MLCVRLPSRPNAHNGISSYDLDAKQLKLNVELPRQLCIRTYFDSRNIILENRHTVYSIQKHSYNTAVIRLYLVWDAAQVVTGTNWWQTRGDTSLCPWQSSEPRGSTQHVFESSLRCKTRQDERGRSSGDSFLLFSLQIRYALHRGSAELCCWDVRIVGTASPKPRCSHTCRNCF